MKYLSADIAKGISWSDMYDVPWIHIEQLLTTKTGCIFSPVIEAQ
jgi:hypothetical protein